MHSSQAQQAQMDRLIAEITDSNVCADLRQQATQLVMGEGNPNADILLIGEAPGKNEDIQGRPFIGAAGKFLDFMLQAAGIDRADVYITNIVKYRPPNNRDPSPQEKQAFWPYLLEQIEIINPKVILTLGRHSGMAFLPGLVISNDHGRSFQVALNGEQKLIIPLYHPAAALYNGGMRQVLTDDFVKAVKIASQAVKTANS